MSDDHHDHPATPAESRLADDARCGCPEARLLINRRAMLGVTASLGTAVFPHHGADAESLIRAADVAMYDAKQAGRNRVAIYSMRKSS